MRFALMFVLLWLLLLGHMLSNQKKESVSEKKPLKLLIVKNIGEKND